MAHKSHPRRGSLQFKPMKRAKRIYPSLKSVEADFKKEILGFAGYKVGMSRILRKEKKKEFVEAVTILECPPLMVYGLRSYKNNGIVSLAAGEVHVENLSKDLKRKFSLPKKRKSDLEKLFKNQDSFDDLRLLIHTQPKKSGMHKKKPEVFEVPLSGSLEKKIEKSKELFGKELRVSDIFKSGEFVDVIAVTKGKGVQGPVKRYGIKLLDHKTEKSRRKPGNMGPWHPHYTDWRIPLAGQMGFTRRTEYNKKILLIDNNPDKINPKGGFKNYGLVKSDYVLIKGSVPGPVKRLILFRPAIRKTIPENAPEITYILK